MAGFDRFNTLWANAGIVIPPTTPQYDAGFAFLGPTPPSVELFNAMFQEQDEKDNWLYNQIAEVIGTPPTELPPTQLADAIRNLITAAQPDLTAYVLKAGDAMTGDLSFTGIGLGTIYDPPSAPTFGVWTPSPMAFGWGDANNIRVRVGDIDVGSIPMNMTAGSYVLKTGDAMTGDLGLPNLWASATVSGLNVQASNIVYANVNNMFFGPGGDGTVLQLSPSYYWNWNVTTGTLSWNNPAGYTFNIDAAANFSFLGSGVVGGNLNVNSVLYVVGRATYNDAMNVTGLTFVANNPAYYYGREPGGRWQWVDNSRELFGFDAVGNANVLAALSVGQTIYAAGVITGAQAINASTTMYAGAGISTPGSVTGSGGVWNSGSFGFYTLGSRNFSFENSWTLAWETTNGNLMWTLANTPFWYWRATDGQCGNGVSLVFGNGAYSNISDERAKTDIKSATVGLAEILLIEPIIFTRIPHVFNTPEGDEENPYEGPPMPTVTYVPEIGFSAQQLQPIIPESVVTIGVQLADGSGGPDDPNPTLGVTIEPIVAALVNAMKEVSSRLTAGGL